MSYEHHFFLKKNEHLATGPDCPQVFWFSGQRNLRVQIAPYGTEIDSYRVEFTLSQAFKVYYNLAQEVAEMFEKEHKVATQFEEEIYYNEEDKADVKAMNSYSLLYTLRSDLKDIHKPMFDELNCEWPEYMVKRLLIELGFIISEMTETDILVYTAG